MSSKILALAMFSVMLAALVVYLCVRLYRKEAELRAVNVQKTEQDGVFIPSPSQEFTVTDQYLYDRCCKYMMERKPFLVESFSLQDLANAMYTNRFYLSKTINRYSGKNFRAYLNYYRVMYAMELFKANMSLRICDLSELSGFHTESSFLSSFKSVMGEPPSHWCARMRRKYITKP